MSKPRKKKRPPKRVLALPDLEQSKAAVLNSLTSRSGQRSYDHAITDFVDWYCSEPRLAFNRTVVLRYRIYLEQKQYAATTINLRLAAVRRVAFEAADSGLLSPELAAGIRRVKGVCRIGVVQRATPLAGSSFRSRLFRREGSQLVNSAKQVSSKSTRAFVGVNSAHRFWLRHAILVTLIRPRRQVRPPSKDLNTPIH
jgi:hypothetical protein